MNRTRLPLYVAVLLAAAALPAAAHHSFPAQYDINKPITLKGKVTKVEWTNPHIFIYADVKDDKGNVVNWAFEMGGPNALLRQGWKRDSLKPDDAVTIEGSLARDGSHLVNARSIVLDATGRKLFAGSSGGEPPTAPAK
ncbi:MAG TPA: DUF6152 family protein [Gammaproteobacteria bacterium]|nr:DUF6152 family protein [Gammaproteobacteria bacterium]